MKEINRKLEKKLTSIGAVWQILSGVVTIFIYATFIKTKGVGLEGIPKMDVTSIQILLDNMYIVTTTIGFLFLSLGFVNLYLSKKITGVKVEVKKAIWLIISALISYLLMDFIAAMLYITSGIFMLSKNKAILQINSVITE